MMYVVELGIFTITAICLYLMSHNLNRKIKEDRENRLYKGFKELFTAFIIYLVGLIAQIIYLNLGGKKEYAIYFDYFVYLGAMYMPIIFFKISKIFQNNNVNFKKYNWMYVLATLLLIGLWTNDFHHMFYVKYSILFSETKFGVLLLIFTIFAYSLYILASAIIIKSAKDKSGMFTWQTFLITLGILIPLAGNFIGIVGLVNTTIYFQAILFIATIVLYYIAIIKLKALNVVPIATQTIIDNMTDSFVVLSMDGTIVDVNKTCINKFASVIDLKPNMSIKDILDKNKIKTNGNNNISDVFKKLQKDMKDAIKKRITLTREYHLKYDELDKYLDIDIQPIKAKKGNEYVAILLLIRDVTQEKKDIEIMTKNENLVILGELAGGVAHDINTPISAIKSGVLMLNSIATTEDEKMLLNSMNSCADKIIALVNSLRNQIRNIGSETVSDISITDVLKDITLILNNELKKNNVTIDLNIEKDVHIMGNPTKLSQVITNIVTNAVQAYEMKGGKVEVAVKEKKNNIVISVKDYAGGIPESVRPYIFKNILTTKGASGTGFGLYLAYSVIKGAFRGDITFDTKTGVGTTFNIVLPK